GASLTHRAHAEHQPRAPPIPVWRPRETDARATAIGARPAVALDLGVTPVEIEVERAANAGAQVTIAGGQAPVRACGARAAASGIARGQRARPHVQAEHAQYRNAKAQHALQCTARRQSEWASCGPLADSAPVLSWPARPARPWRVAHGCVRSSVPHEEAES